jgi:hypothetical protein
MFMHTIVPDIYICGLQIYLQVLDQLASQGISIRVASPKLVMEEAPESYKDVCQVGWSDGLLQYLCFSNSCM